MSTNHWSDCAKYNKPQEGCDCGGLNLTKYLSHPLVVTFVPGTGSFRFLVDDGGRVGFIEPHQTPIWDAAAFASSGGLPNSHGFISRRSYADRMNLYNSVMETIVRYLKAFPLLKSLTRK